MKQDLKQERYLRERLGVSDIDVKLHIGTQANVDFELVTLMPGDVINLNAMALEDANILVSMRGTKPICHLESRLPAGKEASQHVQDYLKVRRDGAAKGLALSFSDANIRRGDAYKALEKAEADAIAAKEAQEAQEAKPVTSIS